MPIELSPLDLTLVTEGRDMELFLDCVIDELTAKVDFLGMGMATDVKILKYYYKMDTKATKSVMTPFELNENLKQAFFMLPIITHEHKLKTIFYSDELYFGGYQDKWYKFNCLDHPEKHKYKTKRLVDYMKLYNLEHQSLKVQDGYGQLEKEAGITRSELKLGRNGLLEAVNFLAATRITDENRHIMSAHVLTITQEICEVLRSRRLAKLVIRNFTFDYGVGIVQDERSLWRQYVWGLLSLKFFRALCGGRDFCLYEYDLHSEISMLDGMKWLCLLKQYSPGYAARKSEDPRHYNTRNIMKSVYLGALKVRPKMSWRELGLILSLNWCLCTVDPITVFLAYGHRFQLGQAVNFGRLKGVYERSVTFSDVIDDQAKLELQDIVDFLRNPSMYVFRGNIPRGCLLMGPPGTGKTLLARAVAGEVATPFYACSACELVGLFAGVGAARVTSLFEKAKSTAPCIVFIDEIDILGRQRGAKMGVEHVERERTFQQLLRDIDLSRDFGVIVLAATNNPNILDPELLSRFEKQIKTDKPDFARRVKILQLHSRRKVLRKDVDFDMIARETFGLTGYDLQDLLDEASATRDLMEISSEALLDVVARYAVVISKEKKISMAYQEAGRALVGALLPEYGRVDNISIIPQCRAGGLTNFLPREDGLFEITVAMGRRIATEVARDVISAKENETRGASNELLQSLQVSSLIERVAWAFSRTREQLPAYSRAKTIISTNIAILHKIAQRLVDIERIDDKELLRLLVDGGAEFKDDGVLVRFGFGKCQS